MIQDRYLDEIIKKIETYGAQYDPNSDLSAEDQLLACEVLVEAAPAKEKDTEDITNENVGVNGMVNDIDKRRVNFELTKKKLELLKKLKTFNCRTPPILIAPVLEEFFKEWPSKITHWPFITQTYTPKTINSVLNRIVKLYTSGYPINNPPGLFTLIIKKRPKKKNKYIYQ